MQDPRDRRASSDSPVVVRDPSPKGDLLGIAESLTELSGEVVCARRRLLLVEDNCDLFHLLSQLLSHWYLEVVGTHDGGSAIELALEHRPEIALVDIGLPGRDGHEVARALRSAFGQSILLLGMSGYGQPEDHARAIRAGFDHFLVKPVPCARLRELTHPVTETETGADRPALASTGAPTAVLAAGTGRSGRLRRRFRRRSTTQNG
jgi:DNA-binding response OmpR family regulator